MSAMSNLRICGAAECLVCATLSNPPSDPPLGSLAIAHNGSHYLIALLQRYVAERVCMSAMSNSGIFGATERSVCATL